jgi:hypothetical protein
VGLLSFFLVCKKKKICPSGSGALPLAATVTAKIFFCNFTLYTVKKKKTPIHGKTPLGVAHFFDADDSGTLTFLVLKCGKKIEFFRYYF